MKKFLIITGMIMCFILGGCSIGSVDAKESSSSTSSSSREYILKYASTGEDFTSMEVLVDKTTGVQYILVITPTGVAITPRVDTSYSRGIFYCQGR